MTLKTTVPIASNLDRLIKEKIKEDGFIPIKEMAKAMDVSYPTLLACKAGRIPKHAVLLKIADYFEVDYLDLISSHNPMRVTTIATYPRRKPSDISLSNKAMQNLKSLSKKRNKEDIKRLATINTLLENPKIIDNIATIIEFKK